MFETSPGLSKPTPSGRTGYNETILENSQEQDSPMSEGCLIDLVSDPADAMRLIQKNPKIIKACE